MHSWVLLNGASGQKSFGPRGAPRQGKTSWLEGQFPKIRDQRKTSGGICVGGLGPPGSRGFLEKFKNRDCGLKSAAWEATQSKRAHPHGGDGESGPRCPGNPRGAGIRGHWVFPGKLTGPSYPAELALPTTLGFGMRLGRGGNKGGGRVQGTPTGPIFLRWWVFGQEFKKKARAPLFLAKGSPAACSQGRGWAGLARPWAG